MAELKGIHGDQTLCQEVVKFLVDFCTGDLDPLNWEFHRKDSLVLYKAQEQFTGVTFTDRRCVKCFVAHLYSQLLIASFATG